MPDAGSPARVVAVLGAGAGGAAAAVDLTQRGHRVRLWSRTRSTLDPFVAAGGIEHTGELGDGRVDLDLVTSDLRAALEGADVALACLPAVALSDLAGRLAQARTTLPLILNPGSTGGALLMATVLERANAAPPAIAELSTLTYIARKYEPHRVTVSRVAGHVRAACLPGGEAALAAALLLYPQATPIRDVLATSLSNLNLVLHPPGAVLGLAWVEATGGRFRFYADGVTPGVARVMQRLDDERRATASALGHDLPTLLEEMARVGTVEPRAARRGDYATAISNSEANRRIPAPDSVRHRYYSEDIGFALRPFVEIAKIADVETPTASALLQLAAIAAPQTDEEALTAARLGIAGLDRDGLLARVVGTARSQVAARPAPRS